jgi:magnesium-transporting ATPase (P-type)
MATLHDTPSPVIYVKGSVESLLSRCSQMVDCHGQIIALKPQQIEQAVEKMAKKGLRVLAFAKK